MSAQGIFNCGSFSENRWLALDKHAKSDIIRYSPLGDSAFLLVNPTGTASNIKLTGHSPTEKLEPGT